MKGWVGLVGWPVADGLPTSVVTHQLQVECRTGKVRQSETDVLPLCHATNTVSQETSVFYLFEYLCQSSTDRLPSIFLQSPLFFLLPFHLAFDFLWLFVYPFLPLFIPSSPPQLFHFSFSGRDGVVLTCDSVLVQIQNVLITCHRCHQSVFLLTFCESFLEPFPASPCSLVIDPLYGMCAQFRFLCFI